MGEKLLSLKWNNHLTALNEMSMKHYLDEIYSDATIMCGEKIYPVHRLILSTCSKYFEDIFAQCKKLNQYPFIIVSDLTNKQLEALLEYMYTGHTSVLQEDLPELMKYGETFKIQGLAIPEKKTSTDHKRKRSVSDSLPPSKRLDIEESIVNNKIKL